MEILADDRLNVVRRPGPAAGAAVLLFLTLWCQVTPAAAATRAATPTTAVPATAPPTVPATAATVAPIPGGTATPSTLPLATRQPSAHVSAIFPILSIAGFLLVLLMLAVQWFLTKPGRRRSWTL
jgi:hypothetical protein